MFFVAIPSERNMYIIAGLYAGDKVVNTIANSEVARQAERTLTAKLKELEMSIWKIARMRIKNG